MKERYFSIIVVSLCILLSGCELQESINASIVEKAFYYIDSEAERKTILNWENASVTEIDYGKEQSHTIWNIKSNEAVDLKDNQVYKVVFRVKDRTILGDIGVYIDRKTRNVLGVDLRE